MVALYPLPKFATDLAYPDFDPPGQLHVTLAFLGKADALADANGLQRVVRQWANSTDPITGEIAGVGLFTARPGTSDIPVRRLSVTARGKAAACGGPVERGD